MKRFLTMALLLISVASLSALAYDFKTDDGLCYNINDDGKSVTVTYESANGYYNYSNLSGDITIPESVSYDGIAYKVTSIGGYAFSGCSGLTSVTIGNSVTTIGQSAFYYCSGLTNVTIGNSVTSIGGTAFAGCSNLTKVLLPTSIESLGDYLFSSTLRDLFVHWEDPITISEGVFSYCYKNTILHVPKGSAKYYQARQGWKNFETIWEDAETDGVTAVRVDENAEAIVDVLNVNGQLIRRGVKRSEALTGLQPGIYIVGGQKVVAQ